MSRAQIVEHYILKLSEPGFEIDQIRKELEANGVPDEEIRVVVRLVDNEVQNRALANIGKDHSKEVIVTGIILALVGAGITVGTFLGWIPSGNSVVIVYGPFFGGIATLFAGLAMKNKVVKSKEKISRSIKRPI